MILPALDPAAHPLSTRLLQHVLAGQAPQRRQHTLDAYAAMDGAYFDAMETAIRHSIQASGRDIETCLADLDQFNALTEDTENDAWYEHAAAFSSMHLDAVMLGFARRRLAATARQALHYARAARQVLEVGCGSGHLCELLADGAPEWHFTLVDRSAAAVQFATALHQARGTGTRVHACLGDLARIPAGDAAFDLVIAAEVLEHAPDARASVAELLRVLRPGGWLVVSVPIALDIAMHPVVFGSADDVVDFLAGFGLRRCAVEIVRPDPDVDAIADVFPGFAGCVNAVFEKPVQPG